MYLERFGCLLKLLDTDVTKTVRIACPELDCWCVVNRLLVSLKNLVDIAQLNIQGYISASAGGTSNIALCTTADKDRTASAGV